MPPLAASVQPPGCLAVPGDGLTPDRASDDKISMKLLENRHRVASHLEDNYGQLPEAGEQAHWGDLADVFPLILFVGRMLGKYRGTSWPGSPESCTGAPVVDAVSA